MDCHDLFGFICIYQFYRRVDGYEQKVRVLGKFLLLVAVHTLSRHHFIVRVIEKGPGQIRAGRAVTA
jgi:hypothetical protein